jgi:hypothetical protein
MTARYPRSSAELSDLRAACKEFVLPGYWPERPPLSRTDVIWTFGSCFAVHLHEALLSQGVPSCNIGMKENANAPPYMRRYLSDIIKERIGDAALPRQIIEQAKCALLTCGLAAAFFDPKGKLADHTGPDVPGEWRALSVSECERDVQATIDHLRAVNSRVRIILTLSPVPINRALWSASPVVADCVSKSTLRVAIDKIVARNSSFVTYWPSFEIVRWLGAHAPGHYGDDDGLQRHVSRRVVDAIAELFVEGYFEAA